MACAAASGTIPIPMERELVAPEALIVPLVGFDGEHYRLGYGGGYYDRTIAAAVRVPSVSVSVMPRHDCQASIRSRMTSP